MSRRYPKSFYIQRKKVMERDGNRCVLCWRRWMLSVHHFPTTLIPSDPNKWDQKYPEGNLVTLCSSCHGKIGVCERNSPFYKMLEEIVVRNGAIMDSTQLWKALQASIEVLT